MKGTAVGIKHKAKSQQKRKDEIVRHMNEFDILRHLVVLSGIINIF